MFEQPLIECLKHQGPVSIVTGSAKGPHLVATWVSYLEIIDNRTLAIPGYAYHQTEKNINDGSGVQLLLGTKELEGRTGPGRGFRLTGQGRFDTEGEIYEKVKSRFNGIRAAFVITVDQVEQLI